MEENRAHQYYKDMKQAGSGAAQFKQGLGYGQGNKGPAPAHPSPTAAGFSLAAPSAASPSGALARAPHVLHPPPPYPPGQRPPSGFPPPPGVSPRPPSVGMRPPGFPTPPMMPPTGQPPPHMARPPYPMGQPPYTQGPAPPAFRPPPPVGYYNPQPGVAYMAGMRAPYLPPPRPPPGMFPSPPQLQLQGLRPSPVMQQPQVPGPQFVGSRPQSSSDPGFQQQQGGQQQQQAQGEEQQRRKEEEQHQKEEEEARRKEEEQRKEEERQHAVAEAWSAYKSDEGTVYYYNTVTGGSSWEKPDSFEGDADKASSNPVPVSSEKVKGTDWLEVVCDDGKKYYYNNRSGETSWQVPPDVEAKLKVKLDPVKAAMLERVKATGAQLAPEYQALAEPAGKAGQDGGNDDVSFTDEDIVSAAAHAHAVHHQPPTHVGHAGAWPLHPPAVVQPPHQPQYHPKFGMLPAVPPPLRPKGTGYGSDGFWQREEAVAAFKDLLSEKGIHAFSRWERELAKLQSDERFKYVPASERRVVFEEFCKEVGASRPKLGPSAAKNSGANAAGTAGRGGTTARAAVEEEVEGDWHVQSAQEAFEELLDEIQEACTPQAKACELDTAGIAATNGSGSRDGANGAVEETDTRSRGRKAEKAGGGAGGGDAGPLVRWDARLTLAQLESFWAGDPRWRRCSAEVRQQLFDARIQPLQQAKAKALKEGFRALLKEQGITSSSRWSKTKDAIRDARRYRAVPRDQREGLFRQYVAELQAAEDAERAQRAEREEKEREAQRKLDTERRAADQRQKTAAHADAVSHYKALLKELVKDCDVTWREAQPRLAKDPQGRASNPALERDEVERIFRDHIQDMLDAAHEAYLDLLDAIIQPLLPSKEEQDLSGLPPPLLRFKDATKLLEADLRFHRLPTDLREVRWRRYVDDIIFNRDYPKARPRTQRRPKRPSELGAMGREEGGLGPSQHLSSRRPREEASSGGIDRAYAREYLQADKKRLKRE